MVKAVFFDLDGTLIDSADWHFMAFNKALSEVLSYSLTITEHNQLYNGLPTRVKLLKLRESGVQITNQQLSDIIELKKKYTNEIIQSYSKFDYEKIQMLDLLSGSYILGCVTNCNRTDTENMLRLSGMLEYFNFIVCNEDVQNNKPAPDCYLRAIKTAQKLIPDLDPLEVLIFEDSPKGVEAAKACGANVITVSNIDFLNSQVVSLILKRLEESV